MRTSFTSHKKDVNKSRGSGVAEKKRWTRTDAAIIKTAETGAETYANTLKKLRKEVDIK